MDTSEQQLITLIEGPALQNVGNDTRNSLPDARNVRQLAFRVCGNVGDPLGISFNDTGCIAITANTEPVFRRDLHQIGSFGKQRAISRFSIRVRIVDDGSWTSERHSRQAFRATYIARISSVTTGMGALKYSSIIRGPIRVGSFCR